ncbi:resolvase [Lactobacillus crispatus]|uniref:IS607 family transposase n=1 Tax=Lactobacillus crispatus TaxID=47770 RepID=UPI000763C979|nr:IS607 family transposase [Lactobacillus crispatus]KWX57917.1 resolvase [Lactobacillus crispatus]QGS06490.1 IS607 family transposase [Lactobacillus crispatus]
MKAGKVMELLQISRSTLRRYRLNGTLKAKKLPTGQYIFDDDSVFFLKNGRSKRLTVIYGRVLTYKQKSDLTNQMQELQDFCLAKGYEVNGSYQDIASGISFKDRKQFFKMLDLIIDGKVERVVITHQDRLSRVGFELFEYLFKNYNTKIEVVSDEANPKTDEQELFEEIISLLHCFSMREYSHRRTERKLIEDALHKKD